jgi:hypothetical protein
MRQECAAAQVLEFRSREGFAGLAGHGQKCPGDRRGFFYFRGGMSTVKKKKPAAPAKKKAAVKKSVKKKRQNIKPSTLVSKALRGIASRIETDEMKASVGDLIRLLQLKHDIEAEQPKEITVTWVEPGEKPAPEK